MIGSHLKVGLWTALAKRPQLFEEARTRHAAFAAHTTLASVLGVLNDERPEAYPAKDALTRAILEESRANLGGIDAARTSSYWTTLLVAAFYPMLRRLRSRIAPGEVGRDDLDQIVVEAFLATAKSMPFRSNDTRLAVRLKSRTRRKVFQHLRAERREAQERDGLALDVEVHGEVHELGIRVRKGKVRFPAAQRDSLARVLMRQVGRTIDQGQIDLLIATYVRGEQLRLIIERQHPDLRPEDRKRIYERLRRQHSRTRARLRKMLQGADLSVPDRPPPGFASSEPMETQETRG
jgi:hypothetical protein